MKKLLLSILFLAVITLQAQPPVQENLNPVTEKGNKSSIVPQIIDFQGRLHDNDGNPVQGSRTVVFSLYAVPSGGTALWTETHAVQFIDGLFGVSLGEDSPFDPAVFSSSGHWLGIRVGSDAEMIPRTRIASVAYALQSDESDPTWTGASNTTGSISRIGKVAIGTDSPEATLHVNGTATGEGNVLFTGEIKLTNPGLAPIEGGGTRMMWYPDKAAFRVGRVVDVFWDTDSIGNYSMAWGFDAKARGEASTAWGFGAVAKNNNSTAWGLWASAEGESSTAWGTVSRATNRGATAWGEETLASGALSTAWGLFTEATQANATAWGNLTIASGVLSTAWGFDARAIGSYSTAWGFATRSSANYTTAWGFSSKALASGATAWGEESEASGTTSTAWGFENKASASLSTAWGVSTRALSYAETTLGTYSTEYSPASTFFINPQDRLFVVGNGTSPSARSDAMVLLKNGNLGLGISNPQARLHVNGRMILNNGVIQRGGTPITATSDLGLYSRTAGSWIRFVTNNAPFVFFTDDGTNGAGANEAMRITNTGIVGIGTSSPNTNSRLHVQGNILTSGQIIITTIGTVWMQTASQNVLDIDGTIRPMNNNAFSIGNSGKRWNTIFATNGSINTSDQRLKNNIEDMSYGLREILQMRPVSYQWIDRYEDGTKLGFLAQDLLEIIPEVVLTREASYNSETQTLEYNAVESLGVFYSDIIPVVVKGIQEQQQIIMNQQQTIDGQQQTIETQQQMIEALLKRVEALEAR